MTSQSSNALGIDSSVAIRSTAFGAASFVASYVIAFVLWSVAELPDPETWSEAFQQALFEAFRESVPAWKASGYLLFNAHQVDLTYDVLGGTESGNLLSLVDGGLLLVAYVVPPLVLAICGYLVATSASVDDAGTGAVAGALQLIGYGLLAVILAFVIPFESGGSAFSVPIANVVVFAGIVYPVVFGGVGGALGGLT